MKICSHDSRSDILSLSLTAVDFVRRGVVSAVIATVAHKVRIDAAAVGAGELGGRVTRGEGAAPLVTVVPTVVHVVAGVAQWDAAPVVTGEVRGQAGVEGWLW